MKDPNLLAENEIHITAKGKVPKYVPYALHVLQEAKISTVIIQALRSRPIAKAVLVTELIKNRIANIHQHTSTSSVAAQSGEEIHQLCSRPKWKSKITLTLSIALFVGLVSSSSLRIANPDLVSGLSSLPTPTSFTAISSRPIGKDRKSRVWRRKEQSSTDNATSFAWYMIGNSRPDDVCCGQAVVNTVGDRDDLVGPSKAVLPIIVYGLGYW
ncbi:OLC1v1012625C1 [Oldenlandia corymbosa var. corymbosa]|uniref:OLC1v1012625C1 n=1 Tax=Oldenlandia corymbosa var. corymbosa TaxID=529605 RepID=A0AAV1DZC5_OLDCO|nr:OLC1v1012625C1 [Oldenlandia corymbosa var. corymbosa]